ncbi:MAG: ABC transporter permease [Lachnospiraceae bacterium]|nr:ABC transporter permease [Lachnospiraceae bacterium]
MNKVNNKNAVNNLAYSGIRTKKNKYIVLVLAVILTSLLFSTLFSVGGSMINEIQESTMRQVGGTYHAGFKYLIKEEYDQMKDDPKIKDVSYRILVGTGANEEFTKIYSECYYAEDENAKYSFSFPVKGKMPAQENEVVVSDRILQALGEPADIGMNIRLDLDINGEIVSNDFTVSGYYEADPICLAQMIYVSKAFQEKFAPEATVPYSRAKSSDLTGRYSVDFNFANSINIDKKVEALIARTALREDVNYGINWAYGASSLDPSVVIICGALVVIFMFAGYLIIYNIFDINIVSDIQEFGLLKTIGTTEKQLKKIVMKRANLISIIGIPVGTGLGVLVAAYLLPVISGQFNTVTVGKGSLHLNIWILLAAVVFSYLTVLFSAGKPCRKAAKVSPVETVKYTEAFDKNGKPKKKLAVVILSLSLGLVILNSVFGFVSGFSMDNYIENLIIADFSVQDAELDNPGARTVNTEAVSHELMDELKRLDGVNSVGAVYINEGGQEFDDANWAKIEKNVLQSKLLEEKFASYGYNEEMRRAELEDYSGKRTLDGKTYGVCEMAADKLKVIETKDGSGKIDWNTFNSGNYVLVTRFTTDNGAVNFLDPGDTAGIRSYDPKYGETKKVVLDSGQEYEYMSFENAPIKEYEVYAVVEIPLALGIRHFGLFDCNYILPEDEFLAQNGADWNAMRVLLDVEDQKEENVNEWLKDYTENIDPTMDYDSKESITEEYASFGRMFKVVGAVLATVLGLIGIMNFANTIITSILVRSRELAMLEAVGMTGKQQNIKLIKEGLVYYIWSVVVSLGVSSILSVTLIRALTENIPMFDWNFTLVPELVCLPPLAILVVCIPLIALKKISERSVVDRLRVE